MSTAENFNSASIQHDNQVPDQEPYKGEAMEALQVREESAALMPVMSIETATERYKTIVEYVSKLMKEGSDFGKIPGTDRSTLLKPGAEKLCTLFGLSKRFAIVKDAEDWESGFFYYLYRCGLYRGEYLIAEGDGSCSSRETKYRWRTAQRVCPKCKQSTIFQSKNDEGFFCWSKKGGCGAKFYSDDASITDQTTGKVANPDIADQVNTIQKMAQKRALIAATLLAVNASEFFTQDYEDFIDVTAESHDSKSAPPAQTEKPPQKRASKKDVNESRRVLIQGVADAFKLLNQHGDVPAWTPKAANDYVALHFQGAAGVDELEEGQVSDLLRMLSERLDSLKNGDARKVNLIASIRGYFDTDMHLTNYLKDHGGKPIEQYTIPELEAIEKDISIPF